MKKHLHVPADELADIFEAQVTGRNVLSTLTESCGEGSHRFRKIAGECHFGSERIPSDSRPSGLAILVPRCIIDRDAHKPTEIEPLIGVARVVACPEWKFGGDIQVRENI